MKAGNEDMSVRIIARIHTDFHSKFGVPRQSGLADTVGKIVFEEPYRNSDALRGIESYTHLWLIWQFSEAIRKDWSPTVRPPRLGGNTRMGVFATRSPFRPNALGLSSVKLERVEWKTENGPVLYVRGADLMDQTPIFDIKPYLPYTDCHVDARGGFADQYAEQRIEVVFPPMLLERLPQDKRAAAIEVLEQDPRPAYQQDGRDYGVSFAGYDIRFCVKENKLIVTDVVSLKKT